MIPSDLLICDATDRPIGIGGIMGGENTEIAETTTSVALEIAMFEPVGISQIGASARPCGPRHRRASSAVSTRTDIDLAIARFVELLRETSPDSGRPRRSRSTR